MQSAKAKKAALETKLTQLRITSERTEIVLTSGKREAIETPSSAQNDDQPVGPLEMRSGGAKDR